MIIPNFTKYYAIYCKSQEILNTLNISSFPIDLQKICDDLGILLFKKSDYLEYHKLAGNIFPKIKIDDGKSYLTYKNGNKLYVIIYDDKPYWRGRFTNAHELGHVLLGHLNDSRLSLDRGGIDRALYCELENEADVFAGNFLAPPTLIHEKLTSHYFPYTASTIRNTFHISTQAAKHSINDYKLWLYCDRLDDEKLLLKRCKKDIHYHRCLNCNSVSFVIDAEFCEVCGVRNNFDRFKGGDEMIYSRIEMDCDNKPLKCPVCENERLPEEGDYCQICGTPFYNDCSALHDKNYDSVCTSGKHLSGDARFCPFCGAETTYLNYKILKPYTIEKEEEEDISFLN